MLTQRGKKKRMSISIQCTSIAEKKVIFFFKVPRFCSFTLFKRAACRRGWVWGIDGRKTEVEEDLSLSHIPAKIIKWNGSGSKWALCGKGGI
jgi:hypothetical protein